MKRGTGHIYEFVCWYRKRAAALSERGLLYFFRNNRGYVLVIVLIITTLFVTVASEFIVEAQTNIGFIKKFDERLQATYIARSGVEMGKLLLYADRAGVSKQITGKSTNKNVDSYQDVWAIEMPPIPLEEGSLQLKIIDENAKINLSIVWTEVAETTPYYGILQNFFINMGFTPDFADIIHDWVDVDKSRMPYGAESPDYYQTLAPPYSAKDGAMNSIDEMLLMKDMTPEIYYGLGGGNYGNETSLVEHNRGRAVMDMDRLMDMTGIDEEEELDMPEEDMELPEIGVEKSRRLSDFFRVYGNRKVFNDEVNKININTAPYRVLSALTENMGDDIVTELIQRRMLNPFQSVNEVSDLIDDETVRDNLLTVQSFIFTIKSIATVGDTTSMITAVYDRSSKKILYWSEE